MVEAKGETSRVKSQSIIQAFVTFGDGRNRADSQDEWALERDSFGSVNSLVNSRRESLALGELESFSI